MDSGIKTANKTDCGGIKIKEGREIKMYVMQHREREKSRRERGDPWEQEGWIKTQKHIGWRMERIACQPGDAPILE